MKRTFQEAELDFFEKASFDRNPLHRDLFYARKTPFGQIVVYGVYAVLSGIGEWLSGRNVRLRHIKAEFRKPLLLGETYDLNIVENEGGAGISFSRGGATLMKLRVSGYAFAESPFQWTSLPENADGFTLRVHAAEDVQYGDEGTLEMPTTNYHCGWSADLSVPSALHLRRDQLPFEQVTALLWSTYFVGMEVPGRQALFSSFEFQFDQRIAPAPFAISPIRVEMDRRFNRLTMKGSATGVSTFILSAFERPAPVQASLQEIRDRVGAGASMAGKRILITGASRGFGAVLAQAFALQGAQTAINFHRSRREAEELAAAIASVAPAPILVQGDASCSDDWERLKTEIGTVDILILNASPAIPSIRFKDQVPADFISFVDRSLRMVAVTGAQFIPQMKAGGTVVLISSVYVTRPEPGFSHYIAAKAAAEALMQSLAAEYGTLRFLIFRAPKMLTDQTNAVTASGDMASTVDVARSLLSSLASFRPDRNLEIHDC